MILFIMWSWHLVSLQEEISEVNHIDFNNILLLHIDFLSFSSFIQISLFSFIIIFLIFLLYISLTIIHKYELSHNKLWFSIDLKVNRESLPINFFKTMRHFFKTRSSALKYYLRFLSLSAFSCIFIAKLLSNTIMSLNITNKLINADLSMELYGNSSYLSNKHYFKHFDRLFISKTLAEDFHYSDQRLKIIPFNQGTFKNKIQNDNEMIPLLTLTILVSNLICLSLSSKITLIIIFKSIIVFSNGIIPLEESLHCNLKLFPNKDFFCIEVLNLMDRICTCETNFDIAIYALLKVKFTNNSNYAFFKIILMLAGDVELNPGPSQNSTLYNPFKTKGLHFVHLNINSIFQKIDELRAISKNSNATVIGVTESKLDSSILDSEIEIEGYVFFEMIDKEMVMGWLVT